MRPRRAGRFSCGDLPWRVLGLGCTLVHRPGQADRLGLSERVAEPSKLLAAQEALALALWIALDTLRGVVGESHFIPLRESSVRAPSAMTVFSIMAKPNRKKGTIQPRRFAVRVAVSSPTWRPVAWKPTAWPVLSSVMSCYPTGRRTRAGRRRTGVGSRCWYPIYVHVSRRTATRARPWRHVE
jgi:hypothetical protein